MINAAFKGNIKLIRQDVQESYNKNEIMKKILN